MGEKKEGKSKAEKKKARGTLLRSVLRKEGSLKALSVSVGSGREGN